MDEVKGRKLAVSFVLRKASSAWLASQAPAGRGCLSGPTSVLVYCGSSLDPCSPAGGFWGPKLPVGLFTRVPFSIYNNPLSPPNPPIRTVRHCNQLLARALQHIAYDPATHVHIDSRFSYYNVAP